MELGLFAQEEFDEYRKWRRRSKKAACKATAAIFRLGRWLSQAHDRLLNDGRGKWTAFLAENEVPRTTAWEAMELFRRAGSEEAVSRMTPTEAKRHFGVVEEKDAVPTPPLSSVKAGGTTADSSDGDGVSATLAARRPGDSPVGPDSGRTLVTTDRPKPAPAQHPTQANRGGDGVRDVESSADPAAEQSTPGGPHRLITTIVKIVRRLEELLDELPRFDLTAEPTDAITREIDQGIAILTEIKGGIAR
jgi:hypothetical protein